MVWENGPKLRKVWRVGLRISAEKGGLTIYVRTSRLALLYISFFTSPCICIALHVMYIYICIYIAWELPPCTTCLLCSHFPSFRLKYVSINAWRTCCRKANGVTKKRDCWQLPTRRLAVDGWRLQRGFLGGQKTPLRTIGTPPGGGKITKERRAQMADPNLPYLKTTLEALPIHKEEPLKPPYPIFL